MIRSAMNSESENSERLQKVLAHAGVASRRQSEELILAGRVTVNGKIVRKLGTKVDPDVDDIRVDTVRLKTPKNPVAFLVMKPKGYLCTTQDERGRPTVLQLLPDSERRLYPVGRLDEDSEGLIILTDDGSLTQLVTHPKHGVPKTYELRIRGKLQGEDVRRVESGVWLAEGRTGPSRIRIKKRIGHPVLSLRRIRIGNLVVGKLRRGQWRKLNQREIRELKSLASTSEGS